MNYAAFVNSTTAPTRTSEVDSVSTSKGSKTVTLKALRECADQELPLSVSVTSTSKEEDFVVYHLTTQSLTTGNSWRAAYRYSEFDAFRTKVETQWTCHDCKCYGSCEAIRDYVSACFPKKNLRLLSTSSGVVAGRKSKFENVLMHLLRCVLLPGSAMKCHHARQHLAKNVFGFLGVDTAADQRSLLQVFVDNHQGGAKMDVETEQCMICLDDVQLDHTHECGHEHEEPMADDGSSAAVLPCGHTFHRECVFKWLLFEFHCPVCRTQVGPSAVTNYCRVRNQVQWWLGDFEEDPLCVADE